MDALNEFPSAFFKAAELRSKKLKLTISGASKEEMNDGKPKLVISFDEDPRRLVLNVGNRTELISRFGRNTENWIGQQVTLVTQRCQGPTGMTWGVRFEEASADDVGAEVDDEIPAEGGGTAVSAPARRPARRGFN